MYINKILKNNSASALAASLAVPGYARAHLYNYIAFSFWTYPSSPKDAALVWATPSRYFGTRSIFGSTDAKIRASLKTLYSNNGIKLLVSAFGPNQTPTSSGFNAGACATQLANYVTAYGLDGVDINWQDTSAF